MKLLLVCSFIMSMYLPLSQAQVVLKGAASFDEEDHRIGGAIGVGASGSGLETTAGFAKVSNNSPENPNQGNFVLDGQLGIKILVADRLNLRGGVGGEVFDTGKRRETDEKVGDTTDLGNGVTIVTMEQREEAILDASRYLYAGAEVKVVGSDRHGGKGLFLTGETRIPSSSDQKVRTNVGFAIRM